MTEVTQNVVLSLVADIVHKQGKTSDAVASDVGEANVAPKKRNKSTKSTPTATKGKPKSGRFWKTEKERCLHKTRLHNIGI